MQHAEAAHPALGRALVLVPSARADVGIVLSKLVVHRCGWIRGTGEGSGLPVYLVQTRFAPRRKATPRGAASSSSRKARGETRASRAVSDEGGMKLASRAVEIVLSTGRSARRYHCGLCCTDGCS